MRRNVRIVLSGACMASVLALPAAAETATAPSATTAARASATGATAAGASANASAGASTGASANASTNTAAAYAAAYASGNRTAGRAAAATGAAGAKPYCARYKCIALTFDDGPWPYTPELLRTLKKHKAKATFFVLGRKVANRMALTRRIQDEGHEIGNHTWDHPKLTDLANDEIMHEVASTQEVIYEATGKYPTMMRPPSGAVDKRVRARMAELSLSVIKWDVQTKDWEARDVKVIKKRVLKGAKRNAIVLLHDIVPETVKAMPDVLTQLKKKGYRFVTVSRLLEGRLPKAGQQYPAP
jgi:peptidoglycan/xylan/chitin deacetylase (PgdA/CDA1 family)